MITRGSFPGIKQNGA